MATASLLAQIMAFCVGIYLGATGHWRVGIGLFISTQVAHYVTEKLCKGSMWLYERTNFSSEDRHQLGREWQLAASFSPDPNFFPIRIRTMLKRFALIGTITGLTYVATVLVLIYLAIEWARAN